jgi:hypothetical protein
MDASGRFGRIPGRFLALADLAVALVTHRVTLPGVAERLPLIAALRARRVPHGLDPELTKQFPDPVPGDVHVRPRRTVKLPEVQ